jgi:hypothetical protein
MIQAIAIIKEHLLFISSEKLEHHYAVYSAIDAMQEKKKQHSLNLGLLLTMDQMNVYGYLTDTLVKFVIIGQGKDQEIANCFEQIHQRYVRLLFNPFVCPESIEIPPGFVNGLINS